jgi:tetratricopeptide (TPR) repeat protein
VADNQRIEDLRRRVQKDPASIAFAQLAEELRRAGQLHEAVEACRAGLAIHPSYLSARVTLGRALLELNEIDHAADELAVVLRSAPENLAAMRAMGEIYLRRGQEAEALAQFRSALTIARNDPDLEETVADLARKLEPKSPTASAEGLTQSEFLQHLPTAPVAPLRPVPPPSVPTPPAAAAPVTMAAVPLPEPEAPAAPAVDPERAQAERTVEALEGWLDAIHVARPDRSA